MPEFLVVSVFHKNSEILWRSITNRRLIDIGMVLDIDSHVRIKFATHTNKHHARIPGEGSASSSSETPACRVSASQFQKILSRTPPHECSPEHGLR